MRICFIAQKSIHTKRWIEYYSTKGYDIHLITNYFDDYNKCKVHVVDYKLLWKLSPLLKAVKIRKIINDIKPDIVHGHQVTPFGLYGYLSGFKPFVLTAWGSDILITTKESLFIKYLTKLILKNADLITCAGDNLKNEIIQLGAKPEKIKIVRFGTDTQKFNSCKKDEDFKANLFSSKSKVVISLRNLEPVYNVETLIKSIPLVLKTHPDTKFLICGKGSEEEYLKQMASSLNISNSIKFLNWISNDDLPKYITSSDIYVSTSLSDGGLAASTKEAMACGLPVIVTDFGDNSKWIENGNNGFVIPVKCPELLGDRIIHLIEHEELRTKFGELGRKLVRDNFEYDDEMKKMELLYGELIRFN